MAEHDDGQFTPWREPDGGFERIMRPDRRAASRRPFTRRQVIVARGTLLLTAAAAGSVFAIGLPSMSPWRGAALAATVTGLVFVATRTRRQIRQILGVRRQHRLDR